MLFQTSLEALMTCDPIAKGSQVNALNIAWLAGRLEKDNCPVKPIEVPGRPALPKLVSPKALVSRKLHTAQGQAALLHALAHIEFNAINLALDAVYRFQNMPDDYYSDWLKVAREESYHFQLLTAHLRSLGFNYGDFPAHNGLWEMAVKTDYDVLVRMALVPRLMEARGLDMVPKIIEKFRSISDSKAVEILEIIQSDEIGHVLIGNHWFRHLCQERQCCPIETFKLLLLKHGRDNVKPPFAYETRQAAGFTQEEMDVLENFNQSLQEV
ncbi:MAG: ferritin-like domain-containing protein [Gammaproteobacteria bacterium]